MRAEPKFRGVKGHRSMTKILMKALGVIVAGRMAENERDVM